MKKTPLPSACSVFRRNAAGELVEVSPEVVAQENKTIIPQLGDYAAFSQQQAERGLSTGRFDY